ncbi:uncharacterized protein DS421_15g514990 [Arachis hypogaea]|nr:uncharacterized protein DS421_15g514990 [Arachis hypogaea]
MLGFFKYLVIGFLQSLSFHSSKYNASLSSTDTNIWRIFANFLSVSGPILYLKVI